MSRRGIQIVITFFDVFSVISFRPGQPEKTFLKNRILAVPKREAKAEAALTVAETQQAIFTPSESTTASVLMREGVPAIAIRRIILADSAPLTFAEIWPPAFPLMSSIAILM